MSRIPIAPLHPSQLEELGLFATNDDNGNNNRDDEFSDVPRIPPQKFKSILELMKDDQHLVLTKKQAIRMFEQKMLLGLPGECLMSLLPRDVVIAALHGDGDDGNSDGVTSSSYQQQ